MPLPSAYQLKKFCMLPWTHYMRRKEKNLDNFGRAALELHYYRPTFYRFGKAETQHKLLNDFDLKASDRVLDIGAYSGKWAKEIVQSYGCEVYAFEPNPRSCKLLDRRSLNFPQIKPFHYGLGDTDFNGKISLHGIGSTIYEEGFPGEDIGHVDIEIRAIDKVWQELNLTRVQLMKVNIEGAEFPLFEKMIEANLLDKVDNYLIQFPEWHPGAYRRRRRIHRALNKTHKKVWDYPFIWEKWIRR